MAYEKLAKLARKSIGEQFYQSAYELKDDRNYFDYMEDDYDDEFDTHQEFADYAEEVFQLLHDINFYQNMIELFADRIDFETIDVSKLSSEQRNDLETTTQMYLDQAVEKFEKKTGIDIYLEGRSGRHVCIENTLKNAIKYDDLCSIQKELKDEYVEKVNEYIIQLRSKL